MTKRNGDSDGGGGDDIIIFIIVGIAIIGGILYFKSRLGDTPRLTPPDYRNRDDLGIRYGPEQTSKYPLSTHPTLAREDELMNRPPPLDAGGTMIDPGLIVGA